MEKDKNIHKDEFAASEDQKNISIFEGDDYFLYIYKKAEKIAAAVYMISDFFSDNEPLKTNIRSAVLSLIDMSLSLNTTLSPDRKDLLNNIVREALSVISYSEIAARTGIESVMNHRIIKGELENFIRTIESRELPQKLGRHFVLSDDFIKDELPAPTPMSGYRQNSSVQHQSVLKPKSHHTHIHQSLVGQRPAAGKVEKSNRKSERQEAIISVIRSKGELSIKDLTGVIKGCSEKTIQRELLVLVEQGILNKVGERRWSRYSLIS
ncbi:MAG: DeoR family transcriptional regulator [Patescibacteria group bacterium]